MLGGLRLQELAEVADVVVRLGDADVKLRVARDAEFLAWIGWNPSVRPVQLVFAGASDAFHDFWCTGIERQRGWQHHAHRFFGAICQGDAVAHALTVKVHIGLGVDGHTVDSLGGHGRVCKKNSTFDFRPEGLWSDSFQVPPNSNSREAMKKEPLRALWFVPNRSYLQ